MHNSPSLLSGFRQAHFGRVVPPKVWSLWLVMMSLAVLALWSAGAIAAPAGEPAGRVLVAVGLVEAVGQDGTVRRLRRREEIFSGDTLRTDRRGRAQIRFSDGARLSLRPNTEIDLEEYRFANNATTDRKRMRLKRGSFRTKTGSIGRRNRSAYRVSTPLAVVGIRGTDWEALQVEGGDLLVSVADGGISMTTTSGQTGLFGSDQPFSAAQVDLGGNLIPLETLPAALEAAGSVAEEPPPEDDDGGPAEADGAEGEGEGDGEDLNLALSGDGDDSGDGSAGGPAAPPPPPQQSAPAGPPGSGGGEAAGPPSPSVAINPSEGGQGVPATNEDIFIRPVLSNAEVLAIVNGNQIGLLSTAQFMATGAPFATDALAGPAGTAGAFNFVLADSTSGNRQAAIDDAFLFVRGDPPVLNRVDNVNEIAGLTFGTFDATGAPPLRFYPTVSNVNNFFGVAGQIPFAVLTPATFADLSARILFVANESQIVVSTGAVSTVLGELVVDFDLGTGQIESGVLDIGFGVNPDDFVFVGDLAGRIENGRLIADVNVALSDNINNLSFQGTGSVSGSLVGTGDAPALALAFLYRDAGGQGQSARGVVQFNGSLVDDEPSLALTAAEQDQMDQGTFFAAATLERDSTVVGGPATDAALSLGSPVFGVNVDDAGEDVVVSSALFGRVPPTLIARQGTAPIDGFRSTFDVAGTGNLSIGSWLGSPTNPIIVLNADGTTPLDDEPVETSVYWATADPTPLNATQLFTGDSTFEPADVDGQANFLAGFVSEGVQAPVLQTAASIDLQADGTIANGILDVVVSKQGEMEFGMRVFFEGTMLASGLVDLVVTGGTDPLGNAVDLLNSTIGGAVIVDAGQTSFLLSFNLQANDPGNDPFAAGVVVVGTGLDNRIDVAFADDYDFSLVGMALFNPLDSAGDNAGQARGIGEGLIFGGAIRPEVDPDVVDPTVTPIIYGSDLATIFDTDFRSPRSDFVISVGAASVETRDDNVLVPGVSPMAGDRPVSWGIWAVSGTDSATVQTDPLNPMSASLLQRTLWAVAAPTPAGTVSGTMRYGGSSAGSAQPIAFLGIGGAHGDVPNDLAGVSDLDFAVDIDFNTGTLSNGGLIVQVPSTELGGGFVFDATFDGSLLDGVAELTLQTLMVTDLLDLGAGGQPGDLPNSSLAGMVTGAAGQSFLGGAVLTGNGGHVEVAFLAPLCASCPAPMIDLGTGLALTAVEESQMADGTVFTAVDTTGFIVGGPAVNALLTGGEPVFGVNFDDSQDTFLLGDPANFGVPPTEIIRRGTADRSTIVNTFNFAGGTGTTLGVWSPDVGLPVLRLNSDGTPSSSGDINTNLYWATTIPLAASGVFRLFQGETDPMVTGGSDTAFAQGSLGPTGPQIAVAGASVMVNGTLVEGILHIAGPSGVGFYEVTFGGMVNLDGTLSLAIDDGFFDGVSGLELPIGAEGPELTGSLVGTIDDPGLLLSFSLPVAGAADAANGNLLLDVSVDGRFSALDQMNVDFGLVGLAVFNPTDDAGALDAAKPLGVGPGFVLGGALRDREVPGGPAIYGNTGSTFAADFRHLRADFLLHAGSSVSDFDANVLVANETVAPDFEVSWGVWNHIDATTLPQALTDPEAPLTNINIDSSVLFAVGRPTPNGAVTGMMTYSGSSASVSTPLAFIGRGGFVGDPSNLTLISRLDVDLDVDFNSGLVSNGNLSMLVNLPSSDGFQFAATFDGQLNGSVAELMVQTLTVEEFDLSSGAVAVPTNLSSINGLITGAAGERFLGGAVLVGGGFHAEAIFLVPGL